MSIVFTNGCFDLLHAGHVQLLLFCRDLAGGDDVYVAIDSDKKIQKDKGIYRPYFSQSERRTMLMTLTSDGHLDSRGLGKYLINWVDTFDTNADLLKLVLKVSPDFIVKGPDWRGKKVIGSEYADVIYAPDYHHKSISTSAIEARVLAKHMGIK